MPFRISSGIASLTAQRHLGINQRQVEKSLRALASGSRTANAGDDAAGFAIGESLRGQASGLKKAQFNAQNAQALVQTAEGGLNEQNNILIRLRELAVYAASDTLGEEERGFLDKEFQALVAEADRIAQTTQYAQKKLLTGSGESFEFHVGPYKGDENSIKFTLDQNTSGSSLSINGLSVSDKSGAIDAIDTLDDSVKKIAGVRASFGAAQSRLEHTINHLGTQIENISAARSLITDVDVADEVTNLTKAQILQDFGVSVLAQANGDSTRVLRLFPG